MRLVTLRVPGHDLTVAARLESDTTAVTYPGFPDVGALLQSDSWQEGERVSFSHDQLAPVIPSPSKIICVGLNYAKHIEEMGHERPDVPTLFIKFPEALIGPYDDAEIPDFNADTLDFEGELAVVIGKYARHVGEADAHAHIGGYAVINDYTQRHIQKRTKQWHQGKSLERTAGFGPWLDTEWQPGPTLTTTVNGEMMQQAPTDDLVFSPAKLIEFISHLYPLNPGDVIATGTPAGVGHARDPKRYLSDGDTVRVEIDGLGAIENTTRILRRQHAMLTSAFPPSEYLYEPESDESDIAMMLCHGWSTAEITAHYEDEENVDALSLLDDIRAEYARCIPSPSEDATKLEAFRDALADRGLSFSFDEGWTKAEAADEGADRATREGRRGYAYCTTQDVDGLIHTGKLYFGFASLDAPNTDADDAVGQEVVDALRDVGFAPEWEGTRAARITCSGLVFELALSD